MDRYRDKPNHYVPHHPMEPVREMPQYPGTGREVPPYPTSAGWNAREYPGMGDDVPLYASGPVREMPQHFGAGREVPLHPPRSGRDERVPYDSGPLPTRQPWDDDGLDSTMSHRNLEEELAHLLAAEPGPPRDAGPEDDLRAPRIDRRRTRPRPRLLGLYRRITQVTALFAAIAVCAACLLVWSIAYTYGQLSETAASVLPMDLALWWPLTLYGPWSVAALSILRAAVQRQPAKRSWGVLLVTSAMAVALCVSHSSHSVLAYVTLGIPPITSLVCFWELVGQFSCERRTRRRARVQQPSRA
ncbi:DUF2637 domain-containing protein [Streptomyces sp. NPDC047974]|uniref:DUF2637 domain-containing protein n=1 Tax=Streptomyces sp. NPDC047974 TaxID=3154343 RepID=UPI0033F90128